MFGFFAKKEMNEAAAKAFWEWFSQKEEWIIASINSKDSNSSDVIWAIDAQIKPVFPYRKRELEFLLGFNDGKGEFFFYHFGDRNLKRDAAKLANMMPADIAGRWSFIAEK